MAFTTEQKRNIEILSKNPEHFLNMVDSLDTYKNQFTQDGKGLIHILVDFYMTQPQEYKSIIKEALNKGFRLDESFREFTPIEQIFRTYRGLDYFSQEHDEELKNLVNLFMLAPDTCSTDDYSRILFTLYKNDEKALFKEVFNTRGTIYNNEYWQIMLEGMIKENNLEILDFMIGNGINVDKDITTIEWKMPTRHSRMIYEKSNLLVCAINYSNDVAHYFLDKLQFPLNGCINFPQPKELNHEFNISSKNPYRTNFPSHTRHDKKIIYSAIHPLDETVRLDNTILFDKIIHKLKNNFLSHLLYVEKITNKKPKKTYSYSSMDEYETPTSLMDKIVEHKNSYFYQKIIKEVKNLAYTCSGQDKLNFINHIYSNKEITYEDKLDFSQKIIPSMQNAKSDGSNYKSYNILDSLIELFYKDMSLNFHQIEIVGKILQLALNNPNPPFNNTNFYKKRLYTHPQMLNTFIAHGLDPNYNYENKKAINPLSPFIFATKDAQFNSDELIYVHKNLNTLKKLAGDNINLSIYENSYYDAGKNLLQYCLENLNSIILRNLNDNEILSLCNKDPISLVPEPSLEVDTYQYITKRLFKLGFNFFNDTVASNFYKLLKHHSDTDFILEVLKHEKRDIKTLSQDIGFWEHVTSEDKFKFILAQGANFNSIQTTLDIIDLENKEIFKHYIHYGGNIQYKDDSNNNLLHYLVQNEEYQIANELLMLNPTLASQNNKQDKIPLQYMIVSFNRECGRVKHQQRSDFSFQKAFFENYLENGDFNGNPKMKKKLMEQINKYTNISEHIPHLKEIISYKIISASTEVKSNTSSTRRKI